MAERLNSAADIHILDFRGLDSIDAMVRRVLALPVRRFAVAGHSMGGRVALQTWRTEPDRISAMALLNTGVHQTAPHEYEQRARLVELAYTMGMQALAEAWLPSMLDAVRQPDAPIDPRLVSMVTRDSPEGFGRQVQALLNRPEAASLLPTISVPLLMLSATGDRWSPPAQHEAMQRQAKAAHLELVPHAGHMAPFEQPDAVSAALGRWLRSEPPD